MRYHHNKGPLLQPIFIFFTQYLDNLKRKPQVTALVYVKALIGGFYLSTSILNTHQYQLFGFVIFS